MCGLASRLSARVVEDASSVESSQAPIFRNRSGSIVVDIEDASLTIRPNRDETLRILLSGGALAAVDQADSLLRFSVFRGEEYEDRGVYILKFDDVDSEIELSVNLAMAIRDADSPDQGRLEQSEDFDMVVVDLAQVNDRG